MMLSSSVEVQDTPRGTLQKKYTIFWLSQTLESLVDPELLMFRIYISEILFMDCLAQIQLPVGHPIHFHDSYPGCLRLSLE